MPEKKYDTIGTSSGTYYTTYNKTYLNRKPWQRDNPKHILSFMPGTVEKILVKPGQAVKEGEIILVFRAMKMMNNILAPMTGKIKSVNATEGVSIPKGTIMVEME